MDSDNVLDFLRFVRCQGWDYDLRIVHGVTYVFQAMNFPPSRFNARICVLVVCRPFHAVAALPKTDARARMSHVNRNGFGGKNFSIEHAAQK